MKESNRYYRSSFDMMRSRGWTVVPYLFKDNSVELEWCRSNEIGDFYYVSECNKSNWSFAFSNPISAENFKRRFQL